MALERQVFLSEAIPEEAGHGELFSGRTPSKYGNISIVPEDHILHHSSPYRFSAGSSSFKILVGVSSWGKLATEGR